MQSRREPSVWPALATPWMALGTSLVAAASLLIAAHGQFLKTLGDTDDAMRLVMVRQFLAGQAWFDVHVSRLDPPGGLDMHWSRLVDAGLAGLHNLLGLFMAPDRAELAMRVAWPLLWVLPPAWAVLAIARRLGGTGGAWLAAVMLIVDILLYVQWWPGRIDHHDIQISMALIAVAAAMRGDRMGGAAAALATAFGLAVGLEDLPFLALTGAGFALRFALDPERGTAPARTYALALLASATLFYVAQTPPSRWGVSVCDALGANLWTAMVVGAAGLLAGVQLTAGRSRAARLAALVVAGAAALGVYAWMMPACTGGPLAAADPRIRAIWLNYITEMQPLLHRFPKDRSELVLGTLMLMGLGAASWLWLGRSRQRRDSGWWLLGAALFLAAAAAFSAKRMISYPSWFAIPLIAAALADLVGRVWRRPLAPGLLVVFLISPPTVLWSVDAVSKQFDKAPATKAPLRLGERCVERAAFGPLAKLPPGLVLSEIDLGPYVLVDTPHSAVQAPYHRMGHGILAANDALSARPGADETRVRALGVTYVLNCPARAQQLNHGGLGPDSLQVRLDRKAIPAWLEPLSDPKAPLQIYRVRPKG